MDQLLAGSATNGLAPSEPLHDGQALVLDKPTPACT